MSREMGNEGAVLSGLKEAPEKFSDTIRMSPLFIFSLIFESCDEYCVEKLIDSWDVECH
jgi:hypothetical protein